VQGRDVIRESMQPWWQGFSSYRHDILRLTEDDDTVYAEGVRTGTNDGSMATPDGVLAPTGRTVELHFRDRGHGRRPGPAGASVHVYFDQLEFLGGLGLLPEPAAQASA
jgi:hypothetical protein